MHQASSRERRMWGALAAIVLLVAAIACSGASQATSPTGVPSAPVSNVESIDPDSPIIVFTGEEFFPRRLEISAGQQVRFMNVSERAIWPASNIHPTHQILPEFDARAPVEPGVMWAFRFDRPGFWRYHNHLNPAEAGLIVVEGGDDGPRPEPIVVDASKLEFEEPRASVRDYLGLLQNDAKLRQYVERYGPASAVRLLADAAARANTLCHDAAHRVGRFAYELFGAAAYSLSSHECQSGAFHGATEALFKERGTANLEEDVATMCGVSPSYFFRLQCIHGVGHGLMAWTSYELYDALQLCDHLQTDREQRACYSGVFMENAEGGLAASMGHQTEYLSDDDPHYPCNELTDRYAGTCYLYQSTRMLAMFGYNYAKVGAACAEALEIAQRECFDSFGRDLAAISLGEPQKAIDLCHEYASDRTHRIYCLQGSVQARFWETDGADEALTMCNLLQVLSEKSGCYWTTIGRAVELYPDDEGFNAFCARVDANYRQWCRR